MCFHIITNEQFQEYKSYGLSPHEIVEAISPEVKIIALTGSEDKNALPTFALNYIGDLKALGKNGYFHLIQDASHEDILTNAMMWKLLKAEIF